MASKNHSLPLCALVILLVEAVLCHAAPTSPFAYWQSMLPKTPFPSALRTRFLDAYATADVKKPFVLSEDNTSGSQLSLQLWCAAKGLDLFAKVPSPDDIHTADFFFEEDLLQTGVELDLHFHDTPTGEGGFLRREAAKSIPFSSDKLPELLQRFYVKPNTIEATIMEMAVKVCEVPGLADEKKFCPTSLESMVDFVTSSLGTHDVKTLSTNGFRRSSNLRQKYTISSPGAKEVKTTKYVTCHPVSYPYSVFYCHMFDAMRLYSVPLVGADGTKLNAVVNCHLNTSAWNPNHIVFQALNVKPGTVPVCHFLPKDTIVWTSNGDIEMVVSSE